MDGQTGIVISDLAFPECLRIHQGALWFSDVLTGDVILLHPDGRREVVARITPIVGGLGWLPGGDLLAVDCLNRQVLRVDANRAVTMHADLTSFFEFPANDMLVGATGDAWVGSYGFNPDTDPVRTSALLCVSPAGAVTAEVPGLVFPNGMGALDDHHLIVSETFADRLAIVRTSGVPEVVRRIDLPRGSTPDGLAVDNRGDVWVALAYSECVLRVSPATGEHARAIEIPGVGVYDCVFESEHRLLVATSDKDETRALAERSGRILAFDV